MTDRHTAPLAAFDLFADLAAETIADLASNSFVREFGQGDVVFHQGSDADRFYVLSSGRVRLTQVTPEGHQIVVRFITPGEGFGIVAGLAGGAYPLTAEVVEPAVTYTWDGAVFKDLMSRHPELGLRSLSMVAKRMQEFQDRNRELATERVERRVARALLRLASQSGTREDDGIRIDLALSQQDVAELTGTTVFSVSRLLSAWEAAGIVITGRRRIVISKPHALVAIAEDLPPTG